MKRLLIPIDFSINATHAVEYGYTLAKQIRANITICNAFIVPAEVPQAGVVVWPMEEYDAIIKLSANELKKIKAKLENEHNGGYNPIISLINEMGTVTDVVNDIIKSHGIDMIIMGAHGSSGLSTLLFGNHARKMIDSANKPLLLIPSSAPIKPIKKIAYATDFKHPQDDLSAIYSLIPLAKLLNAEILLTHVINEAHHSPSFQKWLDNLLLELSNKADYPNIYYRVLEGKNAEDGLDWLCDHGQVDILAMLHRPHSFFDELINGSHTKKIAGNISIPLLVFPSKK